MLRLPLSLSSYEVLRRRIQFFTAFEPETMADPVLNDLKLKYQPLVGMTFQGKYLGELFMPQTGNPRDIISVGQGDPFAATLSGVSAAVLGAYGQRVWRGITGPEQSPNYSDYWLWVEPGFNGVLEMGYPYSFQITECTPFPCGGGNFAHGVHIKAIQPV